MIKENLGNLPVFLDNSKCPKCPKYEKAMCCIGNVYRNIRMLKVCPNEVIIKRNACLYCTLVKVVGENMYCAFWPNYPQPVEKLPACPYELQEKRLLQKTACNSQETVV